MIQPTNEEVEAFINALRYGMKVSHKPEFLIVLAEGWLKAQNGAMLRVVSTDLKPGDVVKANGHWRDKTVEKTETKGEGVIVHWCDGGCTRHRLDFEHTVFRA